MQILGIFLYNAADAAHYIKYGVLTDLFNEQFEPNAGFTTTADGGFCAFCFSSVVNPATPKYI